MAAFGHSVRSSFFFAKFRERITESYPQLFGNSYEDNTPGAEKSLNETFGWWSSFYALSQGRLTDFEKIEKMNFNACLTYLSFEKQKNDIELKRIKNAGKN